MRLRASWLSFVTVAAGALLAVAPGSDLGAQGQGLAVGRPEWAAAVRHDTSRPLRDITPTPAVSTRSDFRVKQPPAGGPVGGADAAVQSFAVAPLAAATGINFDGIGENAPVGYNVNMAPPDTTGEAGVDQYVQWVNSSFAVFDKFSGTLLYGPAGGNTLWAGFGGPCQSRNDGDPIVQYDQLANRWVMTQFALQSGNYMQCVAISVTDNALGAWNRYAFSYTEFPDYPKLAVWHDAYYITFNMFGATGGSFTGGRVCAYDRAKMLTGGPATQVCYQTTAYASFLAADLEGTTLPAAQTPGYVMTRSAGGLKLFKFAVDFLSPANSTFTGPISLPVAAYTAACDQGCIPQPGTPQKLDALGDRLMYRLGYRNLGTRESLVVNHSVDFSKRTAIRWYEIDVTGGTPTIRQESTYAPGDGSHRWMGSIGIDRIGNIAVGYSVSSDTVKPSIRFAGREEGIDALNSLGLETSLHAGTGAQTNGLSRWGDYSSMSIDPVDDCTFWYTSEYLKADGTFNWNTRIASFKFTSCVASTTPDFTLGATQSSATVTQGGSANYTVTVTPTNNYSGSGTLTTGTLPTDVTPTWLLDNSFSGTSSSSRTLRLATSGSTPAGTHNITITATDGTLTHSTTVTLVVNAPVVPDFTITASPGSRTVKRGRSTTYTITVTPTGGFSGPVTLSLTPMPAGVTASLLTNPITISGTTAGTSTLKVDTAANATRGTFTLTIKGTGSNGAPEHSTSVTLKVQ